MNNQKVDVSVIVPVYNVEEYLAPCLDSLLEQGEINLEVIMINDGSTDNSEEIAKRYDEAYENFHLYTIPNGGLGHARNYAVPLAQGKYIIFMDSDDVIVPNTYEKMFRLAEKNGSDMTICNVIRFNSTKEWESTLHQNVFSNVLGVTHIKETPDLMYDTTSWNKLIRKDFYVEHNFQFPENILYEDIPVTIPLHYLANHVSVLNEIGYLWRVRDGATKSITQNTSQMNNMIDRIRILEMLDEFFEKNVTERYLHELKQKKALEVDLLIFVNACENMAREDAMEVFRRVNEYMDKAIDEAAFAKLSVANQQRYTYVRQYDLDKLIDLIHYQTGRYYNAPVREKEGRLFTELPSDLFTVAAREVTSELGNSVYKKYIDKIVQEDGKLEIYCHIYKRRINIASCGEQTIRASLFNEMADEEFELEVVQFESKDLTGKFGIVLNEDTGKEEHYNYNGTCFKVIVDLNKIPLEKFAVGANKLLVYYKNRFSEGRVVMAGCGRSARAAYDKSRIVSGKRAMGVEFGYLGELKLLMYPDAIWAESVSLKEGKLHIVCESPVDGMTAVRMADASEMVPFEAVSSTEYVLDPKQLGEGRYSVKLTGAAGGRPLLTEDKSIEYLDYEAYSLCINSSRNHEIKVSVVQDILLVQEKGSRGNKLCLELENNPFKAEVADVCLFVEDRISGGVTELGHMQKNQFVINFADRKVNQNLYAGTRTLYARVTYTNGSEQIMSVASGRYFSKAVVLETLRVTAYRSGTGVVRLKLEQRWKKGENTAEKRNALIYKLYPKFREEPLNEKLIVFESMWGSKYSCNPQAIYEYIDEHYPEYTCVWSLKDPRTPIKGNAIRVRKGSVDYYHYLATAKYLINNVNFENNYVKREGQIEVQTMHGTPLKTFGLDVTSEFPTERIREQFLERNGRWNYLVVQGRFMEEKGLSCLNFKNETLTTGYPRTDKLFGRSREEADEIKQKLGIPLDKKVIFYAPTWRIRNKFEMQLDLDQLREALSDEYVIMIRVHYFSSKGYKIPEDKEFVFDLNNYGCVEDLYLISDILITDYSSLMFDFALLDKPMIFYTYDMDEYCNELRGIYVDFKAEAPGPLAFNTDEVLEDIQNIERVTAECEERIRLFKDKYLTYEVADSSRLLVEKVLGPHKPSGSMYKVERVIRRQKERIHDTIYEVKKSRLADAIRKLRK